MTKLVTLNEKGVSPKKWKFNAKLAMLKGRPKGLEVPLVAAAIRDDSDPSNSRNDGLLTMFEKSSNIKAPCRPAQ